MSPGFRLLSRPACLMLFWVTLGLTALSAAPTPSPAPAKPAASPAAPAKPAASPKPAPEAKAKGTPQPPPAAIEGFQVPVLPENIALSTAARTKPVDVVGQPRMAKGHPNSFWDQEDVDYFKNLLKTNKDLQIQFAALKAKMDTRIATPPVVPPPEKDADGKWKFIGEVYPPFPGSPDDDPVKRFRRYWYQDSDDVSDLGTVYALTGEAKYAEYAKQILLGRAVMRSTAPGSVRLRSAMGLTTQLLEEALILDHYVRGYDLIHNLPSWTAEEHQKMHDDFIRPLCDLLLYPGAPDIDQQGSFATQNNNRGLIGSVAVLASGYVTGDQELVNAALYGMRTTLTKPNQAGLVSMPPPKDWEAGTADNPSKGLLTQFYAERAIPGGMWVEGTPSYAFYALGSMIDGAEIAWHHGIDLYRHNNSIFKHMFDFPILLSYPDLTTPGLNDAHRESLLGSSTTSTMYEYGYRRYQDPRYLTMINTAAQREYLAALASGTPLEPDSKVKSARFIEMKRIGSVPPSILWDLDPKLGQTIPPSPSINYPSVGFGILRTPAMGGGKGQSLVLSSGPAASHGHPDKLGIDLYALDELLMPSPGINFPYTGNTRIPRWYHTTVAHNTLTVDEGVQDFSTDSRYKAVPRADQTVFAPAATVGLQRAWTSSVYKGVTMDRAVFMTSGYLADLFSAFSAEPHKYDLAWHVRGDVKGDLAFSPLTFDQNVNGYNTLTNVRGASVAADKAWTVASDREGHVARLHTAAGPATQVIVGDSGFWVDHTVGAPGNRPTCPTILQRREGAASTIYGNALDYSGSKDGFVKSVQQTGGLDKGYALLQVGTAAGTDLCFAAYKPGSYTAGPLQTDAMQAFAAMGGGQPTVMYLAGGKTLKVGAASLTRSAPGLAYVERTADGSYLVGNPSPGDPATVAVALPALAGLKAYAVDAEGKKGGVLPQPAAGATVSLTLKAGEKVMYAK